jgi:RNA polymerase sigma-B factor
VPADKVAYVDVRASQTSELFDRLRTASGGDRQRLTDEIIVLNMKVAESVAARFRGRGESLDDHTQVAYMGLTKAVQRFDPDRGNDFLAFAVPTIAGEVKRHFRDAAWAVRPTRRIQELRAKISRVSAELAQDLRRPPKPSDVAVRLDVDLEQVLEALASEGCFTPSSIDERGPGDDGYCLGERLGESDNEFERAEAVALMAPACRRLKPRDRRILYLRFFRGWTQSEIAAELGVTQMQVSRLLTRILTALRDQLSDQVGEAGDLPATVRTA